MTEREKNLYQEALDYHKNFRPGKIEIAATKELANQNDLALAYSPGVAAPCEEIAADARKAALYTDRGNLVAVITNGTAVLGLGDIGPLASKPVMEGKAVLFKNFAGIDVFDIEIAEKNPDKLVDIIASLEPTFGGINLEDIKAPECFFVEQKLKDRVGIPVFHDDQHGTAIIAAAAILNALNLVSKSIERVRLVASGAGAASIACLRLLESLGLSRENMIVVDRNGVIYQGRDETMDKHKAWFARDTTLRTLGDAIIGADVFLGLSGPKILSQKMVEQMGPSPIILALANPTPEIMPEEALAVRPDAIIATGRSDYPNQVNNVLCFPYLFRGALDVGATTINEDMKLACVHALADLTMKEASDVVVAAYGNDSMRFGPEYLIPKPFDPRLITELAPAVADAAMKSGVAERPLANLEEYRQNLSRYVFQSVLLMRPMYEKAKISRRIIAFADGENETILRAVQTVVDDGLARPLLVGRPDVIESKIRALGLRLKHEEEFDCVAPETNARYEQFVTLYHELMCRKGVSERDAHEVLRNNNTVLASMLLREGIVDAMLCGMVGEYRDHLQHISQIVAPVSEVKSMSSVSALVLRKGTFFICDAFVHADPTVDQLVEGALLAAQQIRRFGIDPKVAFVSHSNFGKDNGPATIRLRQALGRVKELEPNLMVDGEMSASSALSPKSREQALRNSSLRGQANLLVMPNIDAANITLNLLTELGEGVSVGPILLGCSKSAHILDPTATVRGVINMSALAVAEAESLRSEV